MKQSLDLNIQVARIIVLVFFFFTGSFSLGRGMGRLESCTQPDWRTKLGEKLCGYSSGCGCREQGLLQTGIVYSNNNNNNNNNHLISTSQSDREI